jgi:hypothetical protein
MSTAILRRAPLGALLCGVSCSGRPKTFLRRTDQVYCGKAGPEVLYASAEDFKLVLISRKCLQNDLP